jgi:hypothetical protein
MVNVPKDLVNSIQVTVNETANNIGICRDIPAQLFHVNIKRTNVAAASTECLYSSAFEIVGDCDRSSYIRSSIDNQGILLIDANQCSLNRIRQMNVDLYEN